MHKTVPSDEDVVGMARRAVAAKGRLRWNLLILAALFIGLCGYFAFVGIRRIEALDAEQLKLGFVFGLGLAVVWTSFGLVGGLCLGKFLVGVRGDLRLEELLVQYHDRLRELGQLPNEAADEYR